MPFANPFIVTTWPILTAAVATATTATAMTAVAATTATAVSTSGFSLSRYRRRVALEPFGRRLKGGGLGLVPWPSFYTLSLPRR